MTAYGPANETSLEFSGPQFDEADEESTRGVGNKFIRYSLDGQGGEGGRGGGGEGWLWRSPAPSGVSVCRPVMKTGPQTQTQT